MLRSNPVHGIAMKTVWVLIPSRVTWKDDCITRIFGALLFRKCVFVFGKNILHEVFENLTLPTVEV